ncbi:MAG: tRNA (guanosine(37)-N1)-methyltransferase TrmD [Pseudomonadota bacterium]|nr:tRNA (guanosine(37)-N1)-methyltransferase TrmD [Pseudomonadota bacterium]
MNFKKKYLVNTLTLFPEAFQEVLNISVIGSAKKKGIWDLKLTDIKNFTDHNQKVDDKPYGGGPGMILKAEVLQNALDSATSKIEKSIFKYQKIMLTPRGERLNQKIVREFSNDEGIIIVCGRYEGFDQRFVDYNKLREISLGDFVLSGGEPGAIALIDSIIRLLPNVLGNPLSLLEESFNQDLLEYQQYTKPRNWNNLKVPEVLLSGNHEKIKDWRSRNSAQSKKIKKKDR